MLNARCCNVALAAAGFVTFAFEHAMHAFVRAVFLGACRRGALMHDAELQPLRVEAIQSVNAVRREGRAIIAANRLRNCPLKSIVHT